MNKLEFIEYITNIPEDIEFTPMKVEVKSHCPNSDGSYRTINKTIKFQCTYTEMVHQLPAFKYKSNFRETYEQVSSEIDNELFLEECRSLKYDVSLVFQHDYSSHTEGGEVPLCILAHLFLECLEEYNIDENTKLFPETRNVLAKIIQNFSMKTKIKSQNFLLKKEKFLAKRLGIK